MDAKVYDEFSELCTKTGISMETAFLWFTGMALAKKRIPIDSSDLTMKGDFDYRRFEKRIVAKPYDYEEYN